MIVVDTNVIAYLLIRGERSAAMDRLLEADPEWIAPQLWLDAVHQCALHLREAGLNRSR